MLSLESFASALVLNKEFKINLQSHWGKIPGVGIVIEYYGTEADRLNAIHKQLEHHEIEHTWVRGALPEEGIQRLPWLQRSKARQRQGVITVHTSQNADAKALLKIYCLHHLLRGLNIRELKSR